MFFNYLYPQASGMAGLRRIKGEAFFALPALRRKYIVCLIGFGKELFERYYFFFVFYQNGDEVECVSNAAVAVVYCFTVVVVT